MSNHDLNAWLGNTEEATDDLGASLLKRVAATFGVPPLKPGAALPALWHWCFFQEPVAPSGLGEDGHPARGGFLPPAARRNRMWAGSRVEFIQPLRAGTEASRLSTITRIEEKNGRSGQLLFVTVSHEFSQGGQLCIREEQDIVYREMTAPNLAPGDPAPVTQWHETVFPDAVMLFRYSAITFNGHRIHYDVPYVVDVEGYPEKVVHGPLIATLNLQAFLRAHPYAQPRAFNFRGVRPLIAPQPFDVGGAVLAPGRAQLWASNDGGLAQIAELVFD
ncbi:transposase [Pseudomonas fluorescens NCIMB 11764]|uniref:Transposase n=1 Tax=Pseudomonas fluorescens NCIMB 11764 TaxID=1221522 RepID=A0A0K1QT12_PSEFL|nr:MaoC family dehydratase N-terminal domain-containing protein [Pseudomonas fluorescens]AKV08909.1 transposase [Pseudomonas fluorescens NCIMB 11764]